MKKRICVLLGIAMLTLSACGQSVSVNVTQPSSDEADSVTDEAVSVTDEVPEEETDEICEVCGAYEYGYKGDSPAPVERSAQMTFRIP